MGATVKLTKLAAAIPSKTAAKAGGTDAEAGAGSVIANHIISKGKGSKELTIFSSKLTTLTRGLEVITAAANAGIEAAQVGAADWACWAGIPQKWFLSTALGCSLHGVVQLPLLIGMGTSSPRMCRPCCMIS
jgi:hypothetical protein